jgi:hypothetical protein
MNLQAYLRLMVQESVNRIWTDNSMTHRKRLKKDIKHSLHKRLVVKKEHGQPQ